MVLGLHTDLADLNWHDNGKGLSESYKEANEEGDGWWGRQRDGGREHLVVNSIPAVSTVNNVPVVLKADKTNARIGRNAGVDGGQHLVHNMETLPLDDAADGAKGS